MPKPRSATLRVAHQRGCPNEKRTALDSIGRGSGCTCKKPRYYTLHRGSDGKPVKGARVRDRQVADRALTALQFAIDEERVDLLPRRRNRLTFNAWADAHLNNLEQDEHRKGSTIRAYRSTLSYSRPILGGLDLDEIGLPEIRLVLRKIRESDPADATLHKHLRHLRGILSAAVEEGRARGNPLTSKFIADLELKRPNDVESYTDVELAKLFAKMQALDYADVYIYIAKIATATAARLGELIACDWDDLSLTDRTLRVKGHYDRVDGLTSPKTGKERTVFLIGPDENGVAPDPLIDAVGLFERWTEISGVQPGDSPLFPAPRSGGRLNGQYVSKLVREARKKAGIPDEGERGRPRKPFHAFRGSYSRITRERGYEPWFRQHNLGHADLALTDGVYGHVSKEALQRAARGAPVSIGQSEG
jgi:integrase